ncbi:haloacid dehalogenase-like hydrolase [Ruegeria denitrificans]|uniref:Haloacid dehalogenase-like hydrolase n=1 Tax=Ruegeria denitrificans TaxID=1715692 RepID=A0A0P1IK48_9RHOB|nr:HAD family hydrolase [Ruegeria denitrificans]CUK18583.1 haloacid dehalogenase-like hydrolase [Ruegeria denitrificans]
MSKHWLIRAAFGSACLVIASTQAFAAPLKSWNDGATKSEIIDFVTTVSDETSDKFVPSEDRIAVFDNDGTLWVEKPLYTHAYAIFSEMKRQIEADQTLLTREPWKSVANKDFGYFEQLYATSEYETLASQLFAAPFGGMTSDDYAKWARDFADSFKHPELGVGIDELTYQPMVELIDFLKANDFTVYIFTADEGAFLRVLAQDLYDIPPERVFGTTVREEFVIENDEPLLVRTYRVDHLNNWDGKPRLIQKVIGRTPILAAGNSNGDQQMLQNTALRGGMSILVHHTDAEREFAYDKHTEKVMPLADKEDWIVVDMAKDWNKVLAEASD